MKRILIAIFIVVLPLLCFSQSFTDLAAIQGVHVIQQSEGHDGNGMSFYDFDNDGWDDLTFPTQNDSISFFRNINGSFMEIGSYLYAPGSIRQLLWVDLTNDEVLDLCISYADLGVRLYENDGNFNFSDITANSGISMMPTSTYGISCADPDLDGDLDLYVCNYSFLATNKFYENQGNGVFIESSLLYGIDNQLNTSFMSTWFDFDNDNDIDLHVINDKLASADALFENLGNGNFVDEAVNLGVLNDGHHPMSSSISDYNNDGFQDVFVSDLANGNIINGVTTDYKLFQNQNGNNFINVAPQMEIDTSLLAWGALWVDYNNDCFEDLYIATSRINVNANPDETSLLFKNNAGLGFELMNDSVFADIINSAYCPVKGDINNDGFYDIVVLTDSIDPNVLLNSGNNGNGYIKITPIGTVSNKQAIGTKIKVHAAGQSQLQTVFCGTALCAQYSQHMIFGVNNATLVDSVEIIFPSGVVVKEYNLPINSSYTILEQVFNQVELAAGADTVYLCQDESLVIGIDGYYNYSWSNGSNDSLIVVNSPGVYSFEATTILTDTVFQSNELTVLWEEFSNVQEVVLQPACGIENLGSIEVLLSNANDSNSTILWSNGAQEFVLDSLSEGLYNYEITTPNNCSVIGSVNLVEGERLNVQFNTFPETDIQLGSVQFFVFGGVPDYTYTMNGLEESSFIDSLTAGTYQVSIQDTNGCEVIVEFTINNASTASLGKEETTSVNVRFIEGAITICSNKTIERGSISLFDFNGRNIDLQDWNEKENCLVNYVSVAQGFYQVNFVINEKEYSELIFIH
ncbi:MAG: CRTAC1 family protein [Crocinitomicaceae bacterium]|nr:CRTAC1 family protein [Crocinitomicaceae bacterium]